MISIIVPVYNVEKYICRCIDSILAQTYKDFELILVDDGSTDSSGKICDDYKERDKRIKVIHKENGGLSSARNVGIDVAEGDYIGFIDSDDYIRKDMYEILYKCIQKNNCDISICNYLFIDEDGNGVTHMNNDLPIKDEIISGYEAIEKMCSYKGFYYITAWNKLYNKHIISSNKFPIGRVHEDVFNSYKILFNSNKVGCVYEPLYYYTINSNGITHKAFNIKRLDILYAYIERIKFSKINNLDLLKITTEKLFWDEMIKYYFMLDNKSSEVKNIYKDLRKKSIYLIPNLIYNHDYNWKNKVAILLFLFNPNIYTRILK